MSYTTLANSRSEIKNVPGQPGTSCHIRSPSHYPGRLGLCEKDPEDQVTSIHCHVSSENSNNGKRWRYKSHDNIKEHTHWSTLEDALIENQFTTRKTGKYVKEENMYPFLPLKTASQANETFCEKNFLFYERILANECRETNRIRRITFCYIKGNKLSQRSSLADQTSRGKMRTFWMNLGQGVSADNTCKR